MSLDLIGLDSNHNKKVFRVAGATLGQGVPLGAWCSFEKDVAPSNNWLMAGTTFDASVYPALNLYLGTNKVPSRYDHNRPSDYEEMTYTANTDITLQYDGEILISQLRAANTNYLIYLDGIAITTLRSTADAFQHITIPFKKGQVLKITDSGLSLFIRYYKHPLFIKATSIASDSDKDSILAQIQAYNTYSTEETWTGKTWIDGKPIYRVVRHTVINSQLAQGYTSSNSIMTGAFTTNAETVVDIFALSYTTAGGWSKLYTTGGGGARAIAWRTDSTIYNNAGDTIPNEQYIVIEYTKSTD